MFGNMTSSTQSINPAKRIIQTTFAALRLPEFIKLFTTILRNRLQGMCDQNNLIIKFQGSGKVNLRTSDNHMIIMFLIDNIVKGEHTNCTVLLKIQKKHLILLTEIIYFLVYLMFMKYVDGL